MARAETLSQRNKISFDWGPSWTYQHPESISYVTATRDTYALGTSSSETKSIVEASGWQSACLSEGAIVVILQRDGFRCTA